jgi:hypothetical protein
MCCQTLVANMLEIEKGWLAAILSLLGAGS